MNYKNVNLAIKKIIEPQGLGMSPKRITLSTSGIPKMIKKLADEDFVKANKDLQALDALYPYGREAKQGVVDAVYSYHMSDQDRRMHTYCT